MKKYLNIWLLLFALIAFEYYCLNFNTNMSILLKLQAKGLIRETIQKIKKEQQEIVIENDFIFVFAGAEMPHKFLMSLGVSIDKKFAEGLN